MSENTISFPVEEVNGQLQMLPVAKMNSTGALYTPKTDGKARKTELSYEENKFTPDPWASWGQADTLPNTIRHKIYSSPMAGQTIYRMVQMMYGNGLCYYDNQEYERTGEYRKVTKSRIERWLRLNRIRTQYLPAVFADWRMLFNTFSELIFSGDMQYISNIYHKPSHFCRLEVQNQKTFKIDHLYYSPQYALGFKPNADEIRRIKLFDWTDQRRFLEKLTGRKFAWHCRYPDGNPYYAKPFWVGLTRENGWLDVNNKIPEIINAMMNNQISIKYIIHIPETYFFLRYTNFNNKDEHEKSKIIDAFIRDINTKLQGHENIYTSIAYLFREHEGGQAEGQIKIEAIDEKVKKDAWVPSADHSNAQIVQALGLHPSQMGLAPEGGKMGAGSGSDQRESYNTGISLNTIEQDILLEPLNWIATFNAQTNPDWDVTFYIDHTMHTTTNNIETGLVPGENAPGQNQIQEP